MKQMPPLILRALRVGLFCLGGAIVLGAMSLLAPFSPLMAKLAGFCAMVLFLLAATLLSASQRLTQWHQRRAHNEGVRRARFGHHRQKVVLAFQSWLSDVSLPTSDYALLRNSINWRRGEHNAPPNFEP